MAQKVDLYKSIALNLGDLILDGVPASLTGSSIQHLSLIQPNPLQLQGKFFYIYSGAGVGQDRVIGSLSSTKHIVFAQVFTSMPSINSNFLITEHFNHNDYQNAVNRFIGVARTRYLQDMVGTAQLVASQYAYPVPSGMTWVHNLRLVPSGNTDFQNDVEVASVYNLPPRYWTIEQSANGTYMINIDPRKIDLNTLDKEMIHIQGQAPPAIAGSDNAEVPADIEEYLVNAASMQLCAGKVRENNEWRSLYAMFRDNVRGSGGNPGLEEYIYRTGRGRKVGG